MFILAHLEFQNPLCDENQSFESVMKSYQFSPRSQEIMENWEAIYECEDECDAVWLQKWAAETKESQEMTKAVNLAFNDLDHADTQLRNMSAQEDFCIQQALSYLSYNNQIGFKPPKHTWMLIPTLTSMNRI